MERARQNLTLNKQVKRMVPMTNAFKTKGFGWKPDLPDTRDFTYAKYLGWWGRHKKTKANVDLRSECPAIYNQGALGSCTANAIAAMFQFVDGKESGDSFLPSRLFIYYNERDREGSILSDSGACIRDGITSVHREGVCPESMWPYDISKFAIKPTVECYDEALNHQSIRYMRIGRSISEMESCLNEGYPFVFGFTVYESFESPSVAETGIVTMPRRTENVLGGHAAMAVGYNKKDKMMLVRNSWGTNWGLEGHFWMPFEYFMDEGLSDDFWTIRSAEV